MQDMQNADGVFSTWIFHEHEGSEDESFTLSNRSPGRASDLPITSPSFRSRSEFRLSALPIEVINLQDQWSNAVRRRRMLCRPEHFVRSPESQIPR